MLFTESPTRLDVHDTGTDIAPAIDYSCVSTSGNEGRSNMPHARLCGALLCLSSIALILTGNATAEWKAANNQVAAAARQPEIAAVLEAVNRIDDALIADDHATFASLLAPDLVVNNPQNGISIAGATGRRNASGLISYSKYMRSIEYAGKLGDMVLLMGDERVVPKGDAPMAGKEMRRRFTDIWKMVSGRWVLAARQSTIVAP
jgi:ketosteroid isomerase-like protein